MATAYLGTRVDDDTIGYDGALEQLYLKRATKLGTTGASVDIGSSAPPAGAGYTLITTDATHATWQLAGSGSGTVTGPGSSTIGYIPTWANTGGTQIGAGIDAATVVLTSDSRLSDARTPTAHKVSHQHLGTDELDLTGMTGLLGTAQTPILHASTHKHGGSDEVATATAAANAIPKAGATGKLDIGWIPTGVSVLTVCIGNDSRLSDDRTASGLRTATTVVNTASSAAPAAGNVLVASSGTAAAWGTPSVTGWTGLLADPQTPASHATSHKHGGSDEVATATAAANAIPKAGATGKLDIGWIPLGSSSTTVTVGNDSRLSDDRTASGIRTATTVVSVSSAAAPSAGQFLRATSSTGAQWETVSFGGDFSGPPSSVSGNLVKFADATGKLGADSGILATNVVVTSDSRLSDARTPVAHATSHQFGGSDVIGTATPTANAIPMADGSNKLAVGWLPTGTTSSTVCIGNDSRLSDARTPVAHAASHQSGGGDAINVGGLSGVLSDPQVANKIATSGTPVTVSSTAPSAGQYLVATSATAAAWTTTSFGDFSGPASSVSGNLVSFNGTTGKLGQDSGVAASSVVLTSDSRLSDARTPVAHATSHKHGGSDEIATATAAANAIPKAGAGGTLAIGWIPTGSTSSTVCIGNDSRLSDDRTASGLRSATTVVSVSSATAPSSGQALVATSSTAATWQNPNAYSLKSATTTVDVSAATAPSAGQALIATDSTHATWQTPAFLPWPANGSWTTKTSSFTASVNTAYFADPSSVNVVMTLPTTHAAGDWIWLVQTKWGNNVQITCPASHTLNNNSGSFTRSLYSVYSYWPGKALVYSLNTTDWVIISGEIS
jgi:hypothetical protein